MLVFIEFINITVISSQDEIETWSKQIYARHRFLSCVLRTLPLVRFVSPSH